MNKHLYRLVWNRALGVLQVASELVGRQGAEGASQAGGAVTATVRPVSLGLWVAFGWIGFASVASAQIATDMHAPGDQRPTVLGSPNAAPLINITTPSKAGVSRNTYTDFNVGADGAVLNNARTPTTTQLAGDIAGNPWLATGTAKIILNEVTGPNPSALNGTIEVAGDRAQVIVANPAGISCDGCGVINANRFTLTTGVPVLNGGALDSYRVTGGNIQINGNGLNASRADYTDVIARAVQVNGNIWSPALKVTTGANEVSADHTQVTAIQGAGDKPIFALDVSALGGMYAGRIELLGTEHGVGVRSAGNIGAESGGLVVTVDGRLENTNKLQSQADAQINATGGVTNTNLISAARELSITTPVDVDNSHGTLNAGRIAVDAHSLRNQGGTIAQTGAQAMSLQAGALSNRAGNIGAPTGDAGAGTDAGSPPATGTPPPATDTGSGGSGDGSAPSGTSPVSPVAPLADGVLHVAGLLDNDGGRISAASGFDLTSDSGLANDGGQLTLRKLTLNGGDLSNRGGALSIDGTTALHVNTVANDGGQLTFNGPLSLAAQTLSNRAGTIQQVDTGATTLAVADTFDNTDGTLASNASALTITSGVLVNERGTIHHAGTDGFTLNTGSWQGANGSLATGSVATITVGTIDHRGATLTATQLALTADRLDNRGGTIATSGTDADTLNVAHALDNSEGGVLATNGDLTLHADLLGNTSGTIQHASTGTLTIDAATLHGAGGTIASNGTLALSGRTTDLSGGTTSAQHIAITTGSLSTRGAVVTATNDLTIHAGTLDNRDTRSLDPDASQGLYGRQVTLDVGSLDNRQGQIQARDGLGVHATGGVDNTGGFIAATGATTIQADSLINHGGTVQTSGAPLAITAEGLLDNSANGLIATDGDLTLAAASLSNADGAIQHAGTGTVAIHAATLDGTHGTIASNGTLRFTGNAMDLTNATTTAQRVSIATDTLLTVGGTLQALGGDPLQLTVRGAMDNSGGTIVSNGALALSAGSLGNRAGSLLAAGADATQVQVAGAFDNTGGTFASAGATTLHAGSLANVGGIVQASATNPLTLTVDGLLTNDRGTVQSNGDVALTAGSLSNHSGNVQTPGALHATVGDTLDNSGGTLIAGGDLTLDATTLLNRNTLSADASAPATGLYGQQVTFHTATFDNAAGQVVARDALNVTGGALSNVDGVLDGQGAVSVSGNALDNTGGQLVQHGDTGALTVHVTQGLTNTAGGVIGAEGTAQLHAGSWDSSGGTAFARHDLTLISDGEVRNRDDGLLQSGGALALTAGGVFDNSGGVLDATDAATIHAASVANVGGQLLGNSVNLTATGALDNRGGTVGSRGGDVVLAANTIDNRSNGTLVAQRDLTIDASALNNAGGTAYATRNLSFQTSGGTLDNTGGQWGAGDTATLTLAQITNTGGHLQADTLWLTTPTLTNDGGEIDGTAVHATVARLNGIGRLYGTDLLDAHVTGDYTHLAGQRLESDGVLSLTVDGTLTNQGTLQTAGELDLTAANIINTAGATINASAADGSASAHITATGTIDNQNGARLEGDTLALTANSVTNTGNISGDAIRVDADTLTNGRDLGTRDAAIDYGEGFIGAAQSLDLHIAQRLANLDAQLYSGGDLSIAGRADGSRVATLDNISGRIQAEGNGTIAADTINNNRRFIETAQVTLSPDEQYALSSERPYDNALTSAEQQRMGQLYQKNDNGGLTIAERQELIAYVHRLGYVHVDQVTDDELAAMNAVINQDAIDNHGHVAAHIVLGPEGNPGAELKQIDTYLTGTRISRESAASELLTGGDLTIDLGTHLTNYASQIAAGGNLAITGQPADGSPDPRIANIAVAGQYTFQRESDLLSLSALPITYLDSNGQWGNTHSDFLTVLGTQALIAAGPTLAASTITAGGTVTIAGGDVTNTAVVVGGGTTAIGIDGLAGPSSTALHDASTVSAGAAGAVAGASGQRANGPGHQGKASGQTVGTADTPLPGLVPPNNGMYSPHGDPNAPFLVTTAPRFAGSSTSSNYLLQALGYDPSTIHKRLGDGYYEQNLVMDQILQLTGRRVVNGGDGLAQYQALMDSAAAQAQALGLSLGAPLTSAQITSLSSDIVWLVDQVVDGQRVLVPVVYLSKATADRLDADGALIAGDSVNIQSSGTVRNDGTISGTQGTSISADTLINQGAIRAGDRVAITTRGDTVNAGTIQANAVAIQAGGSVVNAPALDGIAAHGGAITAGAGGVQLVAANDVINQGIITSAGDATIVAGRDYVQNAATSGQGTKAPAGSLTAAGNAVVIAGRDAVFDQSTVSAGKVAYIDAGRDAHFTAATVSGGAGVGVVAGQDIISDTVTDRSTTASNITEGRTHTTGTTVDTVVRGSTFTSGGDITLQAGRDIDLAAANVKAEGAVGMTAGRDVNLVAGENTHTETQDSVSKHGKTKTTTHSETDDTTTAGTTISGAQGVMASAGRDVNAVAATITSSDGVVAIHADRDINLLAGQNTHSETVDSKTTKKGFFNKKETTTHDATYDTTAVGTTISGKEGIALDAGRNVLGVGTALQSSNGGIAVTAGEQVAFLAAADTHSTEHSEKVRRSGIEWVPNPKQGTQKKATSTEQVTAVGSTLDAAGPIVVMSGGDQTYQAANITSDTGTALVSGGAINFVTATNSDTYQRDSGKHNVAYQAQDHRLRVDTTEVQTSITGPLSMAAADGIHLSVGQKDGETQEDAIARASQQRPGTAWLADLQGQPSVTWNYLTEQHIDAHQHQEGVTGAAAVVITAVMTYFTAGLATGAVASATGATAGSTFAAGTAATAATAATSAGLGNAIVTGAIAGAAGGAAGSAAQGYDWKQGALNGAVGGAISGGLFNEAGSIAQSNQWLDGSWQKVGLHMGAGGASSTLTGGSFWNGALSAGFAEGTSPYMNDIPGGGWGQAAGAAGSGAIGSWLGGGDAGQGALNGLAGYLYNRAMHPAENAAVDKVSAEGLDRTKAQAVACNETKCWSGDNLGVMSGYTKDQVDAIVGAMSPQEYQSTLAQLKQAAPGEFNYSLGDGVSDYWKDNALGTRLAGTVQWLAGGLQAAGALVSAPAMCATGVGCGTAGYLWTGGWDNANAGAYAMVNGQFTYTSGGQLFQYAGLSPGAAELAYGLTQLSPAAYEAYVANKAVNNWSTFNAYARETYVNPTITQSSEAYFWSGLGRGGDQIAAQIATNNGGVTLEQLISARDINLPAWDASNPTAVAAWQDASRSYAANASGTVRAVVGSNLRPGNIWETVELPALQANPKVMEIKVVDPVTGNETLIYKK